MNNGNSSKQVLLSVLGIAVLVIAVVGVSFAFFTYSSTGKNQLLTTGSIFFQFTDGDQITLTNQFPVSKDTGEAYNKENGANDVLKFTITGHDSSEKGIPFKIKAVTGTKPEGESTTAFKDNEIMLNFKETTVGKASLTTNNFSTSKVVGEPGALASGVVIAEGKITAKDTNETDTFELRMWISDKVTFGGDDDTKGTNTYTSEEFSKLYYALKIQVEAGDAAA